MNATPLMLGLLFGSIGGGYFIYGKKQQHWPAMVSGIILCVLPYMISNLWLLSLICLACIAFPWFVEP